jgi:ubiquinone/menaquinone biosynthesis C-methylase UbiE
MNVSEDSRRTDLQWEQWGELEPYYGVLTDSRFRRHRLDHGAKQAFFDSGQAHVEHVMKRCSALMGTHFRPSRVLDFGCGVGRLVVPFAAVADNVVGVDVSASMIAEARRNCIERGLVNVSFAESDDLLMQVDGHYDLVHSSIVLQHVPQDRGRVLFRSLVRKVAAGGFGVLHVTFADAGSVDDLGCPRVADPPASAKRRTLTRIVKDLVRTILGLNASRRQSEPLPEEAQEPVMEMHFYNFSELMFILSREGVTQYSAEFTDHGGAMGALIYFRKS